MSAGAIHRPGLPGYAELWAQSNFSFQHGASHPEELVVRARALGYQALAMTDECSVAGVVRAHTQALQSGLQLLPGAVFALQPIPVDVPGAATVHVRGWRMVVLPRDLGGWGQLCQYITAARGAARKGDYVATLPTPGSRALAGCEVVLVPPRLSPGSEVNQFHELIAVSAFLSSAGVIFDANHVGLWLGVALHQAADDDWWLMQMDQCATRSGVPLVAVGGVLMHARSRKPLHDVLTAIRLGQPVAQCGRALLPNAQAHLRTRLQLGRLYPPDLLANTLEVANRCRFSLTELRYHYPLETVGAGETPSQTLARLTWAGAAWRYGVAASARGGDAEWGGAGALGVAGLSEGGVFDGAAPPRGGPPSAYCEQKLSGGPPLACADLVGVASEYQNPDLNQDQPQSLAQVEAFKPGTAQSHHTPLTGESASVSSAGALTRSAAGRSGVGWDDFCSQHEEPPTPEWRATHQGRPGETQSHTTPHPNRHGEARHQPATRSDSQGEMLTLQTTDTQHCHPHIPPHVKAQIEHELALIAELGYEMYFLTVHDLVRFARSRDILCQGRGSAANSAVCYCLGVTEVDPAKFTLLFERFISRERNEPPDIDVDFEHQRREEVIQYIYAKYGRDRAALTATVISYRPRSALRDVGRALQVDEALIRSLAKEHPGMYSRKLLPERLADALARLPPGTPVPSARTLALWLELSQQLMGFPRHLSQHVGGFVLTQGPLTRLVPVEPAAMAGRSIIQWDKDDLDAVGLLKVDVLALGMLSALRRSLDMLAAKPGALAGLSLNAPHAWSDSGRLTMGAIPKDDEATYRMTADADTVGVFQIESRAQMSMLPRLRPQVFYDLVVQVAIVRPGPIQGGMVHPYLRRRHGFEPVEYPSPELKTALGRTLGVPIFQEQVMQVAMLCAGFSAGEADSLRRAMAAWKRKGGVQKFYDRVLGGMLARGYTAAFAEQIFSQIEGFGEYGFPESHAASFALLVYVSAWIKRHHPDVFLAALLNSQPMGFYSPSQLVQDARRHGVTVLPVDVMVSEWDCALVVGAVSTVAEDGVVGFGKSWVVDGPRSNMGGDVDCAGSKERSVLAGAAPPRDGPPSAYCEQKLSGGPPLARSDLVCGAPENRTHDPRQHTLPAVRSASCAGAPIRSGAGRSGVGGDDFCSQHEEPPTPDRHAPHHGSQGEAQDLTVSQRDGQREARHFAVSQHIGQCDASPPTAPLQSVRLGLRMVSGLSEEAGQRIVEARQQLKRQGQTFANVSQLAQLAQLNQTDLDALAAADALGALAGHRREQVWAASGARAYAHLFQPVAPPDDPLQPSLLPAPTLAQDVVGDYSATGLSLRAHPLSFLRARLAALKLKTAAELAHYPSGRLARACGIVTVRQQPGTAKGVVFVTLEDETGTVNVIVWQAVKEAQRSELMRARLLAVYGVWQRDDETGGQVRHLVAKRLKDLTPWLGELDTSSRDFH